MDLQPILALEQEQGGALAGQGAAYTIDAAAFKEGECASDVISAALKEQDYVIIPKVDFVLMLNRSIALASGKRLSVHPETTLQLMPGCGGCMVRNENIFDGRHVACPEEKNDHDILVEGGIWQFAGSHASPYEESEVILEVDKSATKLFDADGNETNVAGSEGEGGAFLGVFFFCNARNFTIRKATVRRCNFYAVLVAGGSHFVIEDMFYDHNKMDGVHVNGPSSYGLIQRLQGKCGDDFVALNAWDWKDSAVSFGAIHHMLIQDLDCAGDELRLLPGRKTYIDGKQSECPISDCFYRRVHNAYCVKMYQQPNCMNDLTGIIDKSDIAGEISRVWFQDVGLDALTGTGLGEVKVEALFEIIADCEDITYENIRIGLTEEEFVKAGMRLVEVGPKSSTWKRGFTDPKMWAELFDTSLNVHANNLTFKNITFKGEKSVNPETIIGCHSLTVNEDYPNTTPKGGTGKGSLGTVVIE